MASMIKATAPRATAGANTLAPAFSCAMHIQSSLQRAALLRIIHRLAPFCAHRRLSSTFCLRHDRRRGYLRRVIRRLRRRRARLRLDSSSLCRRRPLVEFMFAGHPWDKRPQAGRPSARRPWDRRPLWPCDHDPGDRGSNDRAPDGIGPSEHGPSKHGPGDRGPGDRGPGDRGPDDHGPSDHGPSDRGPGDRGPGGRGPGEHGATRARVKAQASAGQASAGQATEGQATTGQATTGQATAGQADMGQATMGQAGRRMDTSGMDTVSMDTSPFSSIAHTYCKSIAVFGQKHAILPKNKNCNTSILQYSLRESIHPCAARGPSDRGQTGGQAREARVGGKCAHGRGVPELGVPC